MATSKNNNQFQGKIGRTVTYLLNGQWVTRTIGMSDSSPTLLQLAARQVMGLVTFFLRPVRGFIKLGFALAVKNTFLTPNNKASSVNMLKAVAGEYPNQYIDYPNAIFSEGTLPVNTDFKVSLKEDGLLFEWEPSNLLMGMLPTDRVMVIAYCPKKKYAFYETDGSRRQKGSFHLPLVKFDEEVVLHTYAAFIAANQSKISNSTYTGEFRW